MPPSLLGLSTGWSDLLVIFFLYIVNFVTAFATNRVTKVFRIACNVVSNRSCFACEVKCVREPASFIAGSKLRISWLSSKKSYRDHLAFSFPYLQIDSENFWIGRLSVTRTLSVSYSAGWGAGWNVDLHAARKLEMIPFSKIQLVVYYLRSDWLSYC